jgi:hypothetical protein
MRRGKQSLAGRQNRAEDGAPLGGGRFARDRDMDTADPKHDIISDNSRKRFEA